MPQTTPAWTSLCSQTAVPILRCVSIHFEAQVCAHVVLDARHYITACILSWNTLTKTVSWYVMASANTLLLAKWSNKMPKK